MKLISLLVAGFVGASVVVSTTVSAQACNTTTWKKTGGNSFADTVRGRDCGGTMSVRFKGGFGDTGWIPMYKNGFSDFRAQWGDGQVLTDINMKVTGNTMHANFLHKAATGTSTTSGNYVLTGF